MDQNPEPVPTHLWGIDHQTTMLYLECMNVDQGGILDREKLRCNPHRHPQLMGPTMALLHAVSRQEHPTRLADGSQLIGHDDWDCLQDFIAAGMAEEVDDDPTRVRLTNQGWQYAWTLRRQRAMERGDRWERQGDRWVYHSPPWREGAHA